MSTILLCTNKLSKSFGHVKALDGVTLQGRSKSILGLVGSNGAGKTTFIKC